MPFTVEDFMDLLSMLEERPQWRDELRKLLLSEELLALPDVVRELAEEQRALTRQVRELAEGQRALTEGQRILTERQDALTEEVRELASRVNALTEQMGMLTEQVSSLVQWQRGEAGRREGERYERQMVKRAPMLFSGGMGGATEEFQVRERLSEWLKPLLEGEKFLESEDDPTLSDIIWWKDERVAVVEVSLKVNGADVRRALKRAKTLRDAGVDAFAVVIGEDWSSIEVREYAKDEGVEWLIDGVPSEGLIAFRRMPS